MIQEQHLQHKNWRQRLGRRLPHCDLETRHLGIVAVHLVAGQGSGGPGSNVPGEHDVPERLLGVQDVEVVEETPEPGCLHVGPLDVPEEAAEAELWQRGYGAGRAGRKRGEKRVGEERCDEPPVEALRGSTANSGEAVPEPDLGRPQLPQTHGEPGYARQRLLDEPAALSVGELRRHHVPQRRQLVVHCGGLRPVARREVADPPHPPHGIDGFIDISCTLKGRSCHQQMEGEKVQH